MITIEFIVKRTKITWFIDNYWILLVVFLLSSVCSIRLRKIWTSNKQVDVINPQGGGAHRRVFKPKQCL